ncbi:MAG: hypothetical protein HQL93_10020, partial [Magnetococcales bacterium]|nr:hypothetical protein [Magnetococcales bacterium]
MPTNHFINRPIPLSALFIFTFLLFSFLIQLYVNKNNNFPYIGAISDKLLYLDRYGKDIDIIFLGSSDYAASIDPMTLDQEMKQYGCNLRTFNFGVDGLNVVEFMGIMDQLRKQFSNRRPRLVIGVPAHNYGQEQFSTRSHYFMTWFNLHYYISDIWNLPRFKTNKIILI